MDKLIFLDIDGVMNNIKSRKEHFEAVTLGQKTGDRLAGISPRMVALFNELVSDTKAKVILSSTWRHPDVFGVEKTLQRLRDEGLSKDISFSGATGHWHDWTTEQKHDAFIRWGTKNFSHTNVRKMEILEFIGRPNINNVQFIIIDDLAGWGTIQHRVVQTNDVHGFTEKHLKQAKELLK